MIRRGCRPEARGYVIYSPRALREGCTHEGNESHNNEQKADKFYIGEDSSRDEKIHWRKMPLSFIFLLLFNTAYWHKFLGFLIMLVFQSRISN